MLDLKALPKRYLDHLGRERVAEITGVTPGVLSMWISRDSFPVDALSKLLEFDPTPIHEIHPLYPPTKLDKIMSVIVPSSSAPAANNTKCLWKMMDENMEWEPESFNSLYHVRNRAAHRFLLSRREWSFWSDSDMIHPCGDPEWFKRVTRNPEFPDVYAGLNTIYRLFSHKKKIVSVWYIAKEKNGEVEFQGGNDAATKQLLSRGPANQIRKTDWVGFGGVLIHRDVFADIVRTQPQGIVKRPEMRARLKYEYGFFNPIDADFGDDISFCHRAREAGHEIWVDLALNSAHIGDHCYTYLDLKT
jgi:hypothetical protein